MTVYDRRRGQETVQKSVTYFMDGTFWILLPSSPATSENYKPIYAHARLYHVGSMRMRKNVLIGCLFTAAILLFLRDEMTSLLTCKRSAFLKKRCTGVNWFC